MVVPKDGSLGVKRYHGCPGDDLNQFPQTNPTFLFYYLLTDLDIDSTDLIRCGNTLRSGCTATKD